MKSQPKAAGEAASKLISARIAELGDRRGDTLARMRAIDIHEGEEIDAIAFKALIRAAVALNTSGGKKSTQRK